MALARPAASSEAVRKFMRRLRRGDTGPERVLRRALYARGIRYRLHRKDLPGRPDIAVGRLRLAIFVDGCFWHSCPAHQVLPKANAQFWAAKLKENTNRDRRQDAKLVSRGWSVLRVWEHEDPETVADSVAAAWTRFRS